MLSKTLSHMWGKLNFPIFLFNVGLLTHINMDSLMFLAKPCPCLPIIWKLFWLVGWPVPVWLLWWWMGEGSFRCSLNLSAKVLEISHMYSSSQVRSPHWNQYMAPLLLTLGSLSLWETSRFLMVLLPLKWVYMPYLPQIFLILSQRPWVEGITMWTFVFTSLVVGWAPAVLWLLAPSVTSLEGLLSLFSILSKAHLGYLHWVRAVLMWSISLWRNSGLLHTVLALWVRVLITLNFAEMWWWLSHYMHWSMWVGFLYTVIDRLPSASGFTMVSKKGMAASSLVVSTVNGWQGQHC